MNELQIKGLCDEWLKIDVNATTRAQILNLLNDSKYAELNALLSTRILFGTAGLRSKMEAGFNRLNDVTILQSSQGLAQYIIDCHDDPEIHQERSIIIGHDHRHNSKRFAELTAAAFLIKGFKVYYLGSDPSDYTDIEQEVVATPLVPYAIGLYNTLGGIMITASHNPAQDNGYKVYWKNGCQIINPHDVNIQNCILDNLEIDKSHWDTKKMFELHKHNLIYIRKETVDKYIDSLEKQLIKKELSPEIKAVYTPMHGVGLQFVERIVQKLASSPDQKILEIVESQAKPDPDFPTVSFPNPEEKGAMDLAKERADKLGLDLVLSNDPDADRFSCCIKLSNGKWRQLTGNEIGFLFADFMIKSIASKDLAKTYLVNSTVSSQMIKSMAEVEGFHYEDTLTGFKWIGNKAIDLEKAGYHVPFAYEEAIGYMFNVVHDKDGISALTIFLQMYSQWKLQNQDAVSILEQGYEKYGYFKECNGYYLVPELSVTAKVFNDNIRLPNNQYPKELGSYKVISWRDLTIGFDSSTKDNKPVLLSDPTSQMITVSLKPKDSSSGKEVIRFTARGSGTEPKLKVYIESKADTLDRANFLSKDVWGLLRDLWFKPDLYKMKEVV